MPPLLEEFEKTREQLHQQMLSAVSHDLKTPLATMIGSLEIYLRMEDRLTIEKKQTLVKAALHEAHRLDSFITNILDMAKLENNLVKPSFAPNDMEAIIQDSITRLTYKIEKRQVSLRFMGGSKTIKTDAGLLGRAVGLLLDNALRHGGKASVIFIDYGTEQDGPFIRVIDNGSGVVVGKEEKIFSKYTRFSRTDQQNAGTGMGLPICRQIMRLLGGTVQLENSPHGATFVLKLPN